MSWTSSCFSWRDDRWDRWALGRAACGNRPIKTGRVDCYCYCSPPPGMLTVFTNFPLRHLDHFHSLVPGLTMSHRVTQSLAWGSPYHFWFSPFWLHCPGSTLSEYLEISHERPERNTYLVFSSYVISRRYNQQTETESQRRIIRK